MADVGIISNSDIDLFMRGQGMAKVQFQSLASIGIKRYD